MFLSVKGTAEFYGTAHGLAVALQTPPPACWLADFDHPLRRRRPALLRRAGRTATAGARGLGSALATRPLGECQLAFSTKSISPRHPRVTPDPPHSAHRGRSPTSRRSTRPAGCRPSRPCARSASSARGARPARSNSGTAWRCTSARDTRRRSSRRSEAAATSCLTLAAAVARARLPHRRPVERAPPAPGRMLGRRCPAAARLLRLAHSAPGGRSRVCRRARASTPSSRRFAASTPAAQPSHPARGPCAAGAPNAAGWPGLLRAS